MDQFFHLSSRGTSAKQEFKAGLTTFLAMAYIIAVNPAILSSAGIPAMGCITATCLGAGLMSILMGVFANRPIACASGLGVNAVIAGASVSLAGGDWHAAMAVIFIEGIAILLFVLCGLREAIMEAIPVCLRHAISAGLGLFIAVIGLVNAGIITAGQGTLIAFGNVYDPVFLVGMVSIVVTLIFAALRINGGILFAIIISVLVGIPLGVTQAPTGIVSGLDMSTFGAPFLKDSEGVMGITKALTNVSLLILAFSLMMSDFFDTMGTSLAVAKQGDFLTEDGKVKNIRPILIVDSIAAAVGGFLGVSSITTYLESSAGAADGGRTGLTSIFTGLLFVAAAFFAPLIGVVSGAATCGALVYVGFLMMSEVQEIELTNLLEGFSAFIIVLGIPMTYSISDGIGLGFISYVILAVITGQVKKVKPLMWISAAAFLVYFLLT